MKWFAFLAVFVIVQSTDAGFQNFFTGADFLRDQIIKGFLHKLDPIKLDGPFDLNLKEAQLEIQGSIDRLVISGLSEFNVDRWQVDATGSKIEFDLSLDKLASTGRYNIEGLLIHFFPLHGSGDFNIDVKNVRLSGSIQIDRSTKNEISVKAVEVDIHFNGLTIKLENIGNDSDGINDILGVVLVDLYYQYETQIKAAVSDSITNVMNQYLLANKSIHALILARLSPVKVERSEAAAPRRSINVAVDRLFSAIRVNATEGGWDPIHLPSDSDVFSVTLFGATLNGEVSISNLRIGGFSTIHRTGECELTPRPTQDQAEVVVFVGGNDIVIGVDFMWGVGVFKTNLQIELLVRHVDLMIDVILNTETFEVILNNFLLNEIGTIKITIGGIPGGGSDIISNRLSLLSNLVKDSLTYAFQEALRPNVEKLVTGPIFKDFLANELKL